MIQFLVLIFCCVLVRSQLPDIPDFVVDLCTPCASGSKCSTNGACQFFGCVCCRNTIPTCVLPSSCNQTRTVTCGSVTTPPTPSSTAAQTTTPTAAPTTAPTPIPPTTAPTPQPSPQPSPFPTPPLGSPCSVYAQCELCVDKSKHSSRDCFFCGNICKNTTESCSETPKIMMGQQCPTASPTPQPSPQPTPQPSPAPTGQPCPSYKDCANCGNYEITKPSSCHWCYNPMNIDDASCVLSDRLCSVPQTEAVQQGGACPVPISTLTTSLNDQPTPSISSQPNGTPSPSDTTTKSATPEWMIPAIAGGAVCLLCLIALVLAIIARMYIRSHKTNDPMQQQQQYYQQNPNVGYQGVQMSQIHQTPYGTQTYATQMPMPASNRSASNTLTMQQIAPMMTTGTTELQRDPAGYRSARPSNAAITMQTSVSGGDSSYATYAIPQGAQRVSESGSASYATLAVSGGAGAGSSSAAASMEPENYAGLPPYSQMDQGRFDKYKADF